MEVTAKPVLSGLSASREQKTRIAEDATLRTKICRPFTQSLKASFNALYYNHIT